MLTPQDIQNLADLAKIQVTDEEKQTLATEMQAILGYVSELSSVAVTDGEKDESPPTILRNVMREDIKAHQSAQYTEAILKNAPDTEGDFFRVKKIL